jgi:hypothetical protein
VKANATFIRTARIVVLDAETGENLQRIIIHPHGDAEGKFTSRPAQNFADTLIKLHHFSNVVKLCLGNMECVDRLYHRFRYHSFSWIVNVL